ncbi:MAG: helix-turn-helix domain-containing protein [Candidatus Methanomethylophilaceae archaeon]|nr:helix-turn-helix domain-containing protein [Candidatus Methanomethylophilaceae archaeon]
MHCCKLILDTSAVPRGCQCHTMLPVRFDSEGVSVRVLSCSMSGEGSGFSLVRIHGPVGRLEEGTTVYGEGECNMSRVSKDNYLAMVTNDRCTIAHILKESGCSLSSAVPRSETVVVWDVIGPDASRIDGLLSSLEGAGCTCTVVSRGPLESTTEITDRQEAYFMAAMDLGYYDVPKRIDLDELSVRLGCPKSTLNTSLRQTERRILEYHRNACLGRRLLKDD